MWRVTGMGFTAWMLTLLCGSTAALAQNPCAAEPGVALQVEIQAGHVTRPHGYGIAPNWVMVVHPRLPQAPFLIPPGWRAVMEGPGVYNVAIRLISPDGQAEVDFFFGIDPRQRIPGTSRQIATQAVFGGGQQLQPVCGWDIVQPGPIGVSIVAATAQGWCGWRKPWSLPA